MKWGTICKYFQKNNPSGRKNICCCFSVAQLCPTLCDLMDCSTPGLPVFNISQNFLKLMSIELVMPSNHHILCLHVSFCLQSFPASGSFLMNQLFTSGDQVINTSASVSVLPMYIQSWFPLVLTGLISLQSSGLSSIFSNTTVQKHQFFGTQPFYGPVLTSVLNYWKNHRFDYMDLCWQVMPLLFNTLSRLVIAFLPNRWKASLIIMSWLQSLSAVILEPKKIKSATTSTFSSKLQYMQCFHYFDQEYK